jgi:hypothetical protein
LGKAEAVAILYRVQELAYRTQYAELKERARAAGILLRGTPGSLVKRSGTGYDYWYRVYYPSPNSQADEFVGPGDDDGARQEMSDRIDFAGWMVKQVANLRHLQFQTADKKVASVLVELHNRGLFGAGLAVTGTLAYMSWLNEFGVITGAVRTQDIDLARVHELKLGAPVSFLASVRAGRLPFVPVPGLPSQEPPTSVKLPGVEGLRVDVLAPGDQIGKTVPLPELEWHAQTVPHYDYLLEDGREAVVLAGGHCIPVRLPRVERMIWHKFFSSTNRINQPEKSAKDLIQAVTLAAVVVEQDGVVLRDSYREAPPALRLATLAQLPRVWNLLIRHPEVHAALSALD